MLEEKKDFELKEEDLEKVSGGYVQTDWEKAGYSTIFENTISCPSCGSSNTTWYYRPNPNRCVKIECRDCNYLVENDDGISL